MPDANDTPIPSNNQPDALLPGDEFDQFLLQAEQLIEQASRSVPPLAELLSRAAELVGRAAMARPSSIEQFRRLLSAAIQVGRYKDMDWPRMREYAMQGIEGSNRFLNKALLMALPVGLLNGQEAKTAAAEEMLGYLAAVPQDAFAEIHIGYIEQIFGAIEKVVSCGAWVDSAPQKIAIVEQLLRIKYKACAQHPQSSADGEYALLMMGMARCFINEGMDDNGSDAANCAIDILRVMRDEEPGEIRLNALMRAGYIAAEMGGHHLGLIILMARNMERRIEAPMLKSLSKVVSIRLETLQQLRASNGSNEEFESSEILDRAMAADFEIDAQHDWSTLVWEALLASRDYDAAKEYLLRTAWEMRSDAANVLGSANDMAEVARALGMGPWAELAQACRPWGGLFASGHPDNLGGGASTGADRQLAALIKRWESGETPVHPIGWIAAGHWYARNDLKHVALQHMEKLCSLPDWAGAEDIALLWKLRFDVLGPEIAIKRPWPESNGAAVNMAVASAMLDPNGYFRGDSYCHLRFTRLAHFYAASAEFRVKIFIATGEGAWADCQVGIDECARYAVKSLESIE
jgi:hypothetical protein